MGTFYLTGLLIIGQEILEPARLIFSLFFLFFLQVFLSSFFCTKYYIRTLVLKSRMPQWTSSTASTKLAIKVPPVLVNGLTPTPT